jgi:nicotinate phosphoribosyltransferase
VAGAAAWPSEFPYRIRIRLPQPAGLPLAELREELERELDHLCAMSFSDEELRYLRTLRYIKSDFVDFLTVFRFQRRFITVGTDGDTLTIRASGPQVHVMGFEIYVLYIVNELYFRRFDQSAALAEGRARLQAKSPRSRPSAEPARRHPFEFSDFGTRRRFSGAWHDEVVQCSREVPEYFKGTSNVYQAMRSA